MGDPIRADHRFMKRLLDIQFGGKVQHTPEGFDKVGTVFQKAGGSWEQVFNGSTKHISLLKSCLKLAVAKGVIPKSPVWEQNAKKAK